MPHIEISAEKLFEIFGMPVTNTLLMSWVIIGLLAALSIIMVRRLKVVPTSTQNIFETFIEKFLGFMEGVFGSRKSAEKYFPFIATIFIFILISNWAGILPGVGSIGFFEKVGRQTAFTPMLRSSASDLNFTLALGIVAVFAINIFGIAAAGLLKHLSKFFTFKSPLDFFVGVLELISEIAKMISFSFRLFGNVFAGEVLLIMIAFLVPYIIPVPFLMLEIFVGFIQALVFSMLSMVFLSIAISHH